MELLGRIGTYEKLRLYILAASDQKTKLWRFWHAHDRWVAMIRECKAKYRAEFEDMLGAMFFSRLRAQDFSVLHYLCREELDFSSPGRVTAVMAFFAHMLDVWCARSRHVSMEYMLDTLAQPLWSRMKEDVKNTLLKDPGERRSRFRLSSSLEALNPHKQHTRGQSRSGHVAAKDVVVVPSLRNRSASEGRCSSRVPPHLVSRRELPQGLKTLCRVLPRSLPEGGAEPSELMELPPVVPPRLESLVAGATPPPTHRPPPPPVPPKYRPRPSSLEVRDGGGQQAVFL